jgi:hypothetical protein
MGATSSMVLMPSGTVVPVPSPTGGGGGGGGAAAAVGGAAAAPSTAVVPAGAGAAFPKPHPGDGSMDFTKTEMVTPETSLNMSIGAFLSSLGLEQLREVRRSLNLSFLTAEFRIPYLEAGLSWIRLASRIFTLERKGYIVPILFYLSSLCRSNSSIFLDPV